MAYYHDLVTQKSWHELQRLKNLIEFVLIGGWAVYLYTQSLKSKDIDIIIDFDKLSKLKKNYLVSKNDRLKKYEAVKDEVQIDLYLPFYSHLGIPVEKLTKYTNNVEGFTLLEINHLLVLKLFTLTQRGRTPKGHKDFIDIIALIQSKMIDWQEVKKIIKDNNLRASITVFKQFLSEYFEVPELGLNSHYFSRMKKAIVNELDLN